MLAALIERAGRIVVGPGTDPKTEMGPLVSATQLARVGGYLASGQDEGARLVAGGGRPAGLGEEYRDGYFLEPTIFAETDHSMRLVREEIFGPVLVAMEWEDVDDLNLTDPASPFGGYKQSGWGREMGRGALELYTETKSVWVNLT